MRHNAARSTALSPQIPACQLKLRRRRQRCWLCRRATHNSVSRPRAMAHTYCSSAIFITKTLGCFHAVDTAALQACVAVHCPSIEQLRTLRPDVCSNRLGNKVLTPQSAASNTSAHTKARAPVTALGITFCKRLRSTRDCFLQELSGDSTCSARQQPDCDPQFVAAQRDTAAAVPQTAFHCAISFGTSISCFCCKRTRMRQHCRTPATAGMTACTSFGMFAADRTRLARSSTKMYNSLWQGRTGKPTPAAAAAAEML